MFKIPPEGGGGRGYIASSRPNLPEPSYTTVCASIGCSGETAATEFKCVESKSERNTFINIDLFSYHVF